MSKQLSKPTINKTKATPHLENSKNKNCTKVSANIVESTCPNDPNCAATFALVSPTPSLRWRSKPSIKSCYHDNLERGGPSGPIRMLDTAALDAISSHRYDRLKASLHSTILPAVVPTGSQAYNKPQKMMASKSVPTKPQKQTSGPASNKASAQSISTHPKRRVWVPTPSELAKIGDKIPKAFVKTSLTGRKTVEVPTDARSWLRGNLTPIESSSSVTENQINLVRGARLLNKKLKKKDKDQKSPPPPVTTGKKTAQSSKNDLPVSAGKKTAQSSKNDPPVAAGKKTSKASKNDPLVATEKKSTKSSKNEPPPKPSTSSKAKKPKKISSRTSGESSKSFRNKERYPRPLKLNTIYLNTTPRLRSTVEESVSTHSLPPPYTPNEGATASPKKTVPVGFSTYVECFYCRVRYPIDVLREHQDECGKEKLRKRALEAKLALDEISEHFENSFHKLNFDESSCSLFSHHSKPLFIEEGGRLASLPSKISSNEALNQTCWYCGWEYSPEIAERHIADCAAIQGNVLPTAEGKRLRRLVERKMKAYARMNPKKKNLW